MAATVHLGFQTDAGTTPDLSLIHIYRQLEKLEMILHKRPSRMSDLETCLLYTSFGLVYAILPADNLKAFIGMEDSQAAAENSWNTLTPSQQDALAPLLKEWNGMSAAQKKKWLEVAKKAENMSPEDKERFKTHIQDWLNLTPEQRRQARQNFIGFKKLNPQLKTEQWQEYQKLPEEKKRALAARAKSKRRLANLTGEPSSNKVCLLYTSRCV